MDTDLPVLYRMHTPEPDPKSRLERRKVAWRKGAPSLVTDEHREFVAKMALNAKETRQMNCELEVGRKRMESGRAVKAIIDQQQGVGDALTQIATPNLVLHNAPRTDPAPVVVAASSQPPQPPGGGGGGASSSAAAPAATPAAPTLAPSMPPARAPARARPSQAPASPRPARAPAAPSRAPAAPSRAPIQQSGIEADRSRSGSSARGASVPSSGMDTPRGRSISSSSSIRGVPIPAGGEVVPSRASSAAPVTTRDSRDLLARSRSSHGGSPAPMSAGVFEGLTPDQLHRVYVALAQ
jgi:hypothetical protein